MQVPIKSRPAGYSHFFKRYNLPDILQIKSAVSDEYIRAKTRTDGDWILYSNQYVVGDSELEHLVFSLKYERLNLVALRLIFEHLDLQIIVDAVQQSTKSQYTRALWYLWEFIRGDRLPLSDLPTMNATPLLLPKRYVTLKKGILSKRHRVLVNWFAFEDLVVTVERSEEIEAALTVDWRGIIEGLTQAVPRSVLQRAVSFLLLADTKASFAIEGERAEQSMIERWSKVLLEAGRYPLSVDEITRLHQIVLEGQRYIQFGLRTGNVFLGDRTSLGEPHPTYIPPKGQDVQYLIEQWLGLHRFCDEKGVHPLIHAATISFVFVCIHPLEDGNGRLHRYLLNHLLAERKVLPLGVTVPLAHQLATHIEAYKSVLEQHAKGIMPLIRWTEDSMRNIEVLNDTAHLYTH